MKILVAPDSFKGSLTALEVAESIGKGIKNYESNIKVDLLPLADGGEGTVQSLVDATQGEIIKEKVTGPLGEEIKTNYGILGDGKTAVIEMAAASGLPLVPEEKRDPTKTTTYGTGELIKSALEHGVEEIIIGLGGSATTDAGVGMAQALGVSFLDEKGEEVGFGGRYLDKINEIRMDNIDNRVKDTKIRVACDVDNPLFGKDGAAYVYSPQKGADQEMVKVLDKKLRKFNEKVKERLNKDVNKIAGAGAAGGLGAGLVAFLNAELETGIDIILDTVEFEKRLKNVDLVITGEGRLDGQSIYGKTPIGVAKRAKNHNIPVIAIAGSLGPGAKKVLDKGIDAYFSIIDKPDNLKAVIKRSNELLESTAEQIIRIFLINY
ncbi:MAG TPA: glycerate kinase [Halanaerobiales bacterium]|nr:glycerate kinase [Halanaerobiales bacterium]